jgi:hypothetical protein
MAKKKRKSHQSRAGRISEEERRDALRVLEADYQQDVESAADSLIDRIEDGEISDREAFGDALHEEIDSARRVFITQLAKETLLVSRNADAYFEEGLGGDFSDGIDWSAIAFFAFERDVVEDIEREGFDINDDATFSDEDEDDEDEASRG